MKKIDSNIGLRNEIALLEQKQLAEVALMKSQLNLTYESMNPLNLIKTTIKEVTASEELKDNLINMTIGITAGYISKKLFEGVSHNPLRKLLGTALMFSISNAIAKNPEFVKGAAKGVFKLLSVGLRKIKSTR